MCGDTVRTEEGGGGTNPVSSLIPSPVHTSNLNMARGRRDNQSARRNLRLLTDLYVSFTHRVLISCK